jgi:crotonobetainyl-CoA:carnitine CoA-transferase CaiB-like acyl-CoA transferase
VVTRRCKKLGISLRAPHISRAGGPLLGNGMQGIRVVDLTAHLSGPFCTWQLAALGADVIKIEPPATGEPARETPPLKDGHSLYFDSLNRGKRSLALDLRAPEGKAVLHRLLATADVLVENFRPGVRDRLGCSDAELERVNPKLIRVSISGFGQESAMAKRPAFDIIVQALSGMMSINGPENGPLCRVGFSIGDIAAGLFATIAILDRLYERDCRGVARPAPIDISMLACQVALLENGYARFLNTGKLPQPLGTRHPSATPFESFPTADEPIVIANSGRKGWPVFCEALGLPALATDPRFAEESARLDNHAAFRAIVIAELAKHPRAWWLERFAAGDVPCAPVNTIRDFAEGPLGAEQGAIGSAVAADGVALKFARSPLQRNDADAEPAAPLLGQHSDALLKELGLSANEIDGLFARGVVRGVGTPRS